MGNLNSNKKSEETRPLLEDYEEIQPIFQKLKLVLIGSHDVGKNSIGNTIFQKKFFSSWGFRKNADIKVSHVVSQRWIQLTRTPGWKEYFNDPKKTKRKIQKCVLSLYDTEPDAVLLALKVESEMPASTIVTLENFLSNQLWSHTIVVFTNGEKLRGDPIEDYITRNNLMSLIDKCGKRYFVFEENDKQIIETIEDFIVSKCSTGCFKPNRKNEDLPLDLKDLVRRIGSKINSITVFKQKLQLQLNKKKLKDTESLLDSKDKEIKRLHEIVKEKEVEIRRLKTQNTTKLQDLKTQKEDNAHVAYRCELAQDAKTVNSKIQTSIKLQKLPSKDSALQNWRTTLLQILEELSGEELKKMKYYMNDNDEYKINRSSLEEADRVELADLMLRVWGKEQSVKNIRDLLKKIPRNDDVILNLLTPALREVSGDIT